MENIKMFYSFDCSQFVAVEKTNAEIEIDLVCQSLAEAFGSDVKARDKIAPVKTIYLEKFCEKTWELFEFEDQEFQGVFEHWVDNEKIPKKISDFCECIDLLNAYGFDVRKIFIIGTPADTPKRLYETNLAPLTDALFCKSFFYTGDGAGCETLIVNLK